jgi:hypothetical protein
LTVVAIPPDRSPEEVALSVGGVLVDAGPYASQEDAYDAISELLEDEDRRPST